MIILRGLAACQRNRLSVVADDWPDKASTDSSMTAETSRSRLVTYENLIGEGMPTEKRIDSRVHHCCESLRRNGFIDLIGPRPVLCPTWGHVP